MTPQVAPATRATLAQFFETIFGGAPGLIELRAFPSKARRFAPLADLGSLLAFLAEHAQAEELYFGVAARADASSGKLENCSTLGALFADLDFKTMPEPEARPRLAAFPLPPSIVVRSGHGLHVYYLLREPLDLTDPTQCAQARGLLARLAHTLGGDRSAAEPARVLRVPRTWNRKAEPVRVGLELCEPSRRYNLSELEEWLPPIPAADTNGSARFHAPEAPIGPGERRSYLFRLARSLKTRGLTEAAARAAAREENATRCRPPVPDDEVVRQVRSAFEQADRPGFAPRPVGERDAPGPAGDGLALIPLGELLGEPDAGPAYVVDGRLPVGGLGLLAGKPKAGKTTLARCLAFAVARGAPWLGFATTRGEVLYLALEEKRQEVRAHFRALGATGADPIYILCSTAPLDALARLRREAEQRRPALIIIDPLFRLIRVPGERGNDYATMTAALEPLLTLARETGAHVLLVHHLGKGERTDGDSILGSTAIFAAVDTALLLKRGERYRTLASIQRYGEDLEEITITLDPTTRDVTAGAARAEAEAADAGRLLLEFLAGADAPVTEAELDGAVECRRQTWKRALRALVAGNQIVRTGRGGKADPFRYSGSYKYPGTREPETVFPAQAAVLPREDSGSHVPRSAVVPAVPVPDTDEEEL